MLDQEAMFLLLFARVAVAVCSELLCTVHFFPVVSGISVSCRSSLSQEQKQRTDCAFSHRAQTQIRVELFLPSPKNRERRALQKEQLERVIIFTTLTVSKWSNI